MPSRFSLFVFAMAAAFLPAFSAPGAGAQPVEVIPAEFRGAMQPQIAMSPDGLVHVVFSKAASIYYIGSTDGGATFSHPVHIAGLPKLALGMRRGPRIVADKKLIIVSAISHDEGTLRCWSSADHGKTWIAAPASLNDTPGSAREGLHAMAGNGAGLVAAAWLDLRNNAGMEIWSAVSSDGGATWGTNQRVYKSPDGHVCECCHPSIAIDSQGHIAVMFRNWIAGSRDMYLVTSTDAGRSFGSAQKLGSGTWKLDGCPMDGGALAFAPTGRLASAWRREKAVFATDNDASLEKRLADSALQPVIAFGSFGTAEVWEQDGGLMVKKENASPIRLADNARFAAAAGAPGYAPIIVWESNISGAKTILAMPLK